MHTKDLHAVTGAFGYSGKYIAQRLLDKGLPVITLTNSIHRENPFGEKIKAYPFNFNTPEKLVQALSNVAVLYNTYWVRFNYKLFAHADAVKNTIALFDAAKAAGVKRLIHISITNPSEDSHLEYFNGKAKLEKYLQESGISYAILRPTVLFGKEDILINNIAWILRKLPAFAVFGDGQYKLQPIYVDDLARIAVEQGEKAENIIINAIGPETFTYKGLVEAIGERIGIKRPILTINPTLGYIMGMIIGKLVGDIMITREEIEGLMEDLLYVNATPTGTTRLTDWIKEHSNTLGKKYTSELARRIDRKSAYKSN